MNALQRLLLATILLAAGLYPVPAQTGAVKVTMGQGRAKIALLEGSASWTPMGAAAPRSLGTQDLLGRGDRVTTHKDSRLEIELPDGSIVRFDQQTTFVLASAAYDPGSGKKDMDIELLLGKTWASVPKFSGAKGRFAVSTRTSVAGVRGTDFRMNVNDDDSAMLKVYDGEVAVRRRQEDQRKFAGKPSPYTKPHPVSGPRPVSMETWTYIVGSLQQINIAADGTAAPPFRFDIEADLNDWVRWNQERNRHYGR